jgi:hypothetical protein
MLVDFSTARPSPSNLKAVGVTAVGRYLGWDSVAGFSSIGKNLTRAEAQRYLDAGIEIFLSFEYTPDAATRGTAQGRLDGSLAMSQLAQLGAPPSMCVFFAVDFDIPDYAPHLPDTAANAMAKLGPVGQYFEAIKQLKHSYEIGGYGGYYAIKRLFDAGLITLGWQTVAWSGGEHDERAVIYQQASPVQVAGADLDIREHVVTAMDYGQWPRPAAQNMVTIPAASETAPEEAMPFVLDYLKQNAAVVLPVPAGKTKVIIYCDYGFGQEHVPPEIRVGLNPSGAFEQFDVKPSWGTPSVLSTNKSPYVTIGRVDAGDVIVTVDFQ